MLLRRKEPRSATAEINRLLMEELQRVRDYGIIVSVTRDDTTPVWEYWGEDLGGKGDETTTV